jgi:hypothetical protein
VGPLAERISVGRARGNGLAKGLWLEQPTPLALAAYPPEELASNTDADTLAYDYERGFASEDGPNDWWSEAQLVACRFMRQAHDRGLAGLLRDLEYVRERATVQRVLAKRDLHRRWTEPRRSQAAKQA